MEYKHLMELKIIGEEALASFIGAALTNNDLSVIRVEVKSIKESRVNRKRREYAVESRLFFENNDEYAKFYDTYIRKNIAYDVKGSVAVARLITSLTQNQLTYGVVVTLDPYYAREFDGDRIYSVWVYERK